MGWLSHCNRYRMLWGKEEELPVPVVRVVALVALGRRKTKRFNGSWGVGMDEGFDR